MKSYDLYKSSFSDDQKMIEYNCEDLNNYLNTNSAKQYLSVTDVLTSFANTYGRFFVKHAFEKNDRWREDLARSFHYRFLAIETAFKVYQLPNPEETDLYLSSFGLLRSLQTCANLLCGLVCAGNSEFAISVYNRLHSILMTENGKSDAYWKNCSYEPCVAILFAKHNKIDSSALKENFSLGEFECFFDESNDCSEKDSKYVGFLINFHKAHRDGLTEKTAIFANPPDYTIPFEIQFIERTLELKISNDKKSFLPLLWDIDITEIEDFHDDEFTPRVKNYWDLIAAQK